MFEPESTDDHDLRSVPIWGDVRLPEAEEVREEYEEARDASDVLAVLDRLLDEVVDVVDGREEQLEGPVCAQLERGLAECKHRLRSAPFEFFLSIGGRPNRVEEVQAFTAVKFVAEPEAIGGHAADAIAQLELLLHVVDLVAYLRGSIEEASRRLAECSREQGAQVRAREEVERRYPDLDARPPEMARSWRRLDAGCRATAVLIRESKERLARDRAAMACVDEQLTGPGIDAEDLRAAVTEIVVDHDYSVWSKDLRELVESKLSRLRIPFDYHVHYQNLEEQRELEGVPSRLRSQSGLRLGVVTASVVVTVGVLGYTLAPSAAVGPPRRSVDEYAELDESELNPPEPSGESETKRALFERDLAQLSTVVRHPHVNSRGSRHGARFILQPSVEAELLAATVFGPDTRLTVAVPQSGGAVEIAGDGSPIVRPDRLCGGDVLGSLRILVGDRQVFDVRLPESEIPRWCAAAQSG